MAVAKEVSDVHPDGPWTRKFFAGAGERTVDRATRNCSDGVRLGCVHIRGCLACKSARVRGPPPRARRECHVESRLPLRDRCSQRFYVRGRIAEALGPKVFEVRPQPGSVSGPAHERRGVPIRRGRERPASAPSRSTAKLGSIPFGRLVARSSDCRAAIGSLVQSPPWNLPNARASITDMSRMPVPRTSTCRLSRRSKVPTRQTSR
jgi:hypothetical protein